MHSSPQSVSSSCWPATQACCPPGLRPGTHAQQFATNLYRALASLVLHQVNYPLTRQQLATLLNTVDIELTRDGATTPSLALFRAILQRRLRDPELAAREAGFLSLIGDPELSADMPSAGADAGLVTASFEDTDYQTESGSGVGSRLLSLFHRLQVLAITSASERVRSEAWLCLVTFLLNYPHKAKFLHTFLAFCLRQLEYPRLTGRLLAITVHTGLVFDLPIDRLQTVHLDVAILLSVGAAIEREPVISLRVALLALLRILFSGLPEESAQTHFRDYLQGFLTASPVTRISARLLELGEGGVYFLSYCCPVTGTSTTVARPNVHQPSLILPAGCYG